MATTKAATTILTRALLSSKTTTTRRRTIATVVRLPQQHRSMISYPISGCNTIQNDPTTSSRRLSFFRLRQESTFDDRRRHCYRTTLRHFSGPSFSTSSTNDSHNHKNNNDDDECDVFGVVDVDYRSPLGSLISRLKMVSITGCVLSVCVLPALVYLKNNGVDLPNAQQATMGTIAALGATGSTAALHFVFGAYVLEMKSIVPAAATTSTTTSSSSSDESSDETNANHPNANHPNANHPNANNVLLRATTRSVFGFWKDTHVFDPTTDVQPYKGHRPFANFCANGTPLYVHPERLDVVTKQWLLMGRRRKGAENNNNNNNGSGNNNNNGETNNNNNNNLDFRDSEGLAIKKKTKKKKNDDDGDDDEFF